MVDPVLRVVRKITGLNSLLLLNQPIPIVLIIGSTENSKPTTKHQMSAFSFLLFHFEKRRGLSLFQMEQQHKTLADIWYFVELVSSCQRIQWKELEKTNTKFLCLLVYLFVVVAIWKEKRPGCLSFFSIVTITKK